MDIVRVVAEALHGKNIDIDYDNIHVIDDGDYQGTLLFVIPEKCYQPFDYWYVRISYGSCSVCDTLQGIIENEDFKQVADDLFTLALHIAQGLKRME